MVWKDVTVGFTIAGIVAAFVPSSFFQTMFWGAGSGELSLAQVTTQALVGPAVAFFTFIGSMGNIPLAAVLFSNGVGFAGIMAFIFSDLVVFPVLRINAKYLGWRMALYILGVFLGSLVVTAVALHYGFSWAGWLPDPSAVKAVTERDFFQFDHSTVLGLSFVGVSAAAVIWRIKARGITLTWPEDWIERVLLVLTGFAGIWLAGGLLLGFWIG